MSNQLLNVAAYLPPSLVKATLAAEAPLPPSEVQIHHLTGAVLFADVSGFTTLTEALGQKGSEGPEELTRLMNRYFGWMIAFIEAEGGEVVKFGGDSLTVLFQATGEPLSHAVRRAFQAAETMRSAMEEFGTMPSSVGQVSLRMKFGIGAGAVQWAQLGGIKSRWEYIIAGEALIQATRAERQANQGQITLSPAAAALIHPEHLDRPELFAPDWDSLEYPDVVEKVLRCYLPKPVLAWLNKDLHGWLATLRPMSVLFVGIKGLDYAKPEGVYRLHHFFRAAQQIVYEYQGSLPRLTVDDKGTVLLLLFGAPPYSHEDDAERAVRCALELQQLAREQELQLAIGITTGRVFAGPVGGRTRREYTVMGDTVNLAARLMGVAGPGEIRCNYETYRSSVEQMLFEELPPIQVKGKTEPVQIFAPIGKRRLARQLEQFSQQDIKNALLSRQPQLARLTEQLAQVQAGQNRLLIIEGEAGIGKSYLVKHLVRLAQAQGLTTLLGQGRSIAQTVPYRAWRDIFFAFFKLTQGVSPSQVWQQAAQLVPDLEDYFPLLNEVLSVHFPENGLTAVLDPAGRQESLAYLWQSLLHVTASTRPVVLIFENAQWLDTRSWELVAATATAAASYRIFLVLVMRPFANSSRCLEFTTRPETPPTEYLRLETLPADDTLAIVAASLGLTGHELPEGLSELLRNRAAGNPFFAEELFHTLRQNGFVTLKEMQATQRCLVNDDLNRVAQMLPATIENTILARIDQLRPGAQLTLKVAAVIGQAFAFSTLRDTLQSHLNVNESALTSYLDDLTYLGFIQPTSPEPDPSFVFKNAITREVTYQSVLFDRRRELHKTVATWYEATYSPTTEGGLKSLKSGATDPLLKLTRSLPPASTPLTPYYSLLVYHWHQAEDEAKERYYAIRLAEQAVREYANAEAQGYLNRALDLTPLNDLADRFGLLLAREQVFHRRGDRERQILDLTSLAELVQKTQNPDQQAQVSLRRARYAEAVGRYQDTIEAAQATIRYGQAAHDPGQVGRAYLLWASALAHTGQFAEAREKLAQAAALTQTHQMVSVEIEGLFLEATIDWLQGHYPQALTTAGQAVTLSRTHAQLKLEAFCLVLLGKVEYRLHHYLVAKDYFEQALPLFFTIGLKQGELTPLHYLGLIYLEQGQYLAARDYFEQVIDTAREVADKNILAEAMVNLGFVYGHTGDYMAAQGYLRQALTLFQEMGDPLGEAATLCQFGRIYYNFDDNRSTRRYAELALEIYRKIGCKEGESLALTYLGHAQVSLNKIPEAIETYEHAVKLRDSMGQRAASIAPLTGLAYAHLAQNNPDTALMLTRQILRWLKNHGIAGVDNPLQVYLRLYQVLQALPQTTEQAKLMLTTAYAALQGSAAQIEDETGRTRYLQQVKVNQDILAYWAGKTPAPASAVPRKRKTKENLANNDT